MADVLQPVQQYAPRSPRPRRHPAPVPGPDPAQIATVQSAGLDPRTDGATVRAEP